MRKRIKHTNLLQLGLLDPKDSEFNELVFPCRGCGFAHRPQLWHSFVSSAASWPDNSYLFLTEELDNPSDPNAIMVVSGGEIFGTVGYVGKEFTTRIKEILDSAANYRIDMVNTDDAGKKEISLVLTWETFEQNQIRITMRKEEHDRRQDLGLPVTKPLRYMQHIVGGFTEMAVASYEILDHSRPQGKRTVVLTLENGEERRVYEPYFADMQRPSFVDDMNKIEFED